MAKINYVSKDNLTLYNEKAKARFDNKIESVKVNGTVVGIDGKAVDITVPTDNKDLTNGAGYIKAAEAPVQSVNGQTGAVTIPAASVMTGATAAADGKQGLVPAPQAAQEGLYLRGDGTWAKPEGKEYTAATSTSDGLMSSADFTKLQGVEAGANKFTLTAATSDALGGVTIGDNISNTDGRISLTKANVTGALAYTPLTPDETQEKINAAVGDVTSFETVVLGATDALPETGAKGTIYFKPDTHTDANDSYDEYIYVGSAWEKIGNTDIDLTGYAQSDDFVPMTDAEVTALFA